MKKLNLAALLLGALLLLGLGATNASAAMKCGAGKCGASMEKSVKADGKTCTTCKSDKKASKDCKCKGDKASKDCKCEGKCKCETKKAMKCGSGKCGDKK